MHKISDVLYLGKVVLPKATDATSEPQPTNHIVVIDCSGSMYSDLPKIREQLKAKLPKLLAEGDTLSIIWFSGRGEFGILVEGEPVATLKDLSDLNKAIDRWLKPVCLTGFKEPLLEASKLVDRLGGCCSLFFMSDGYDNQWGQSEIIQSIVEVAEKCASVTIVEYGYYCNHPLMVQMAEEAGGTILFNEDFRSYEPTFDAAMQKRPLGAKRIEVDLGHEPVRGFAFAIDGGSLVAFKADGTTVKVPEHLSAVWFIAEAQPSELSETTEDSHAAAYAAIALYAQRMDTSTVLAILKFTGDVRFINQWAGCFGKQKYAEFVDAVTEAVFDASCRLVDGHDPDAVPPDDAFTVLDLLNILVSDDANHILVDSPEFRYKRTSLAREQVVALPDDIKEQIDQLDPEKDAKKIEKLAAPFQALTFQADPMPRGVPIGGLVFNETRPNVSIQVRKTGKVDIKARKGKEHKALPDRFPTFIYRNYTIIRDGIINIDRLPMRVTKATTQKLRDRGLPFKAIRSPDGESLEVLQTRLKKASKDREIDVVFDLRALPIINRNMVRSVSAETLFRKQYELTKLRAAQKVFNATVKSLGDDRVSQGFAIMYGPEAASWLKDQGITDYSGFNPGGKQSEIQDSYVGKELNVKLKGIASLPSLSDVAKKTAAGKKLTPREALLQATIDEIEAVKNGDTCKASSDPQAVLKAWVESELNALKGKVREALYDVSQIRWSIVVGQTWFTEFSTLDEDTLTIDVDGTEITGTVEMKEVVIPV